MGRSGRGGRRSLAWVRGGSTEPPADQSRRHLAKKETQKKAWRQEGDPVPRCCGGMKQRAAKVPGQTVLVGCAGIAFAFIVSTLIAQRTSGDIEGEALSISFAVGPNIEALSGVRTELRHLQALVLQRLELGGKRPVAVSDSDTIGQVRRELDARLSLCVVQRSDEAVLFARFQEALRR